MATTINSYSVSLTLNASEYIKNSALSRQETAALTRQINAARNPQEKFNRTYDQLEKALQSGAIELSTYQRLLGVARNKFDVASGAAKRFADAERDAASSAKEFASAQSRAQSIIQSTLTPSEKLRFQIDELQKLQAKGAVSAHEASAAISRMKDSMNPSLVSKFKSELVGLVAGYASLAAAQRLVSSVRGRMLEVDELAKSARAIGENINQLERFRFAVGEIAGIDGPAATTMLTKLTQRIGEASMGVGEAGKNFERLGLDVNKLKDLSPVQQFEALAEAIRSVENPTEQVAYATKFFEESGAKLLPLLRATNEQYESSANQVDRLGTSLSQIDVDRIEATNDALNRVQTSLSGILNNLAAMPGVSGTLDAVSGVLSFVGALDGLKNVSGPEDLTRKMYRLGLVSKESLDAVTNATESVKKDTAASASSFAIEIPDTEIEQKLGSIFDGVVSARKSLIDKVTDLAKKSEEEQTRRLRDQAKIRQQISEKALENARKYFEEERQRQMKIRQDVVSLMSGAGAEVGSGADVAFEAQRTNAALASTLSMPQATPTDEQLLNKAQEQLSVLQKQNESQGKMVATLEKILKEQQENGFKRLR